MQLSPELESVLRTMTLGASIVLEGRAPTVLMKLPTGTKFREAPVGYGQFEVHPYDPEGMLTRMVFEVYDHGAEIAHRCAWMSF